MIKCFKFQLFCSQVAFIGEFTLKCSNNAEKVALFAEADGKVTPVVRVGDTQYQVRHRFSYHLKYILT